MITIVRPIGFRHHGASLVYCAMNALMATTFAIRMILSRRIIQLA